MTVLPSKRPKPLEQQNDRTLELGKLADEIEGAQWEDEEVTAITEPPVRQRLSSVTDEGADARAATFLERVLGTIPMAWRFPSLVVILGFALAIFYLWKTLP